ncbi:MAG: hypothetical protein FWD22_01270 [Treponema sp.]|nr:hypothetical protein [Treponema sp.]
MKSNKPALAIFISIVCAALVIFGVMVIEKVFVKENKLVKAEKQVKYILESETDFDIIVEYIESDPERSKFLGIALVELAKNEDKYVINFENRYPRYKAYREMVNELARKDYSQWVADVITGKIETEFEANIFEYLSTLEDNRYLNEAIVRFGTALEAAGDRGFAIRQNKDAFITGAIGLYISQFPESNTQLARTIIGQRIGSFIDLSKELTEEIAGIPLNKLYLYLYIKYFGLQNFIDRKMDAFMAKAQPGYRWDGQSWSMNVVTELINDLTTMGKGISQNYYSMFNIALNRDDAVYAYIALQVLKQIGFDDPVLHGWLNRDYRRFERRLSIDTTTYSSYGLSGSRTSSRPIIFADEIREVREAVKDKQDIPFEEILKQAVTDSGRRGGFIPRVSAEEEARREIWNNSGFYTHDFVSKSITTWNLKHQLLFVAAIICLLAAIICSLAIYKSYYWHFNGPDYILTWIVWPIIGLILFFVFWNKYDNLTGFQIKPIIVFVIISSILTIITVKNRLLSIPGRSLWGLLISACGDICFKMNNNETSQFYFNTINVSADKRAEKLIKNNKTADAERLFKDRIAWINFLKKTNRDDMLEAIRTSTNNTINSGIPAELIMDDKEYTHFLAGFTAFDKNEANQLAIQNLVSSTMVQRCNGGKRIMLDVITNIIDLLELNINPSIYLACVQEENALNASWLWKKMEKNADTCESPDEWFVSLVTPMDPEKIQKSLSISCLFNIIRSGFSKCKDYVPVLALLVQARQYVDKNNTYYNVNEYNHILEFHKTKIEKAQKQAQKETEKGKKKQA